jgi:hypothetical protein
MTGKRELTAGKFERRHPDIALAVSETATGTLVTAIEDSGPNRGSPVADRSGPLGSRDRLLWELSQAVLAIRRREVAHAQGYRDAQTGEIRQLETHHVLFRSRGGTHERSNLAGLSAESHRIRHGRSTP